MGVFLKRMQINNVIKSILQTKILLVEIPSSEIYKRVYMHVDLGKLFQISPLSPISVSIQP